jgi:precorrin-6A/cobalt-precorrin-6A reductase
LFERHRIDMVIAKNSGGDATYAKIAAARELGLPVILLRRPVPPFEVPAEAVLSSVEEVLGWLDRH